MRYELKNPATKEETVIYLTPTEALNPDHFNDEENAVELEVISQYQLCEWLVDNYRQYGTNLEIVTDKS
eukprot:CAMPEP_0201281918 /NCGR_PEP_ID=MMETSP1317-20130820/4381_1 /ASSEMBLY_ACC=CAM_ASM_000770 /TAXON_ID=187299 /ORGANISM="Undescribed Undescribed, Strain Undescribed" /LENGTH=68 /DNA_ID=CAMNT_0047593165 /DNA_START=933 /DNA_END=1139 /DNA_ORIENTATION=-